MKQFITKVTVTGADDSNEPSHLIELAKEFPFVEFGILISRSSMGNTRFPSKEWLVKLIDTCKGRNMNFAGHICGSWVNELLLGKWPKWDLLSIHEDFMSPDMFNRWQINTHAEPHRVYDIQLPFILRELDRNKQSVIFQYDDVNTGLIDISREADCNNISALFDLSHGAGVLPETWPQPLEGISCGYAGGLSPENVAGQIGKIENIIGDNLIWIDAETKLRSPDDIIFDLDKVRAFLKASKPWVISEERS
jgi:hypothetical protein